MKNQDLYESSGFETGEQSSYRLGKRHGFLLGLVCCGLVAGLVFGYITLNYQLVENARCCGM